MFKKYLTLFDKIDYHTKTYKGFNEIEWKLFLSTYQNIFRHIDKSVFQWYFNLTNYFTILSTKSNEQIGIYGLLGIHTNLNGKSVNTYLCHNVGIKKEYAGKGFFQFVGEKALDNVLNTHDLALGFPNQASKKGHFRLGWKEIGSMQFISYTSIKKINSSFHSKYLYEKVTALPDSINQLVDTTSNMFSFRVQKYSDFLNWRIEKPLSEYKIYLIRESQKIVGYLILKEYCEDDQKRLHLVDCLFINTEVLDDLILFCINEYENNDYNILNTWIVVDSFYKDFFMDNMFVDQSDMPIYPIILFMKDDVYDLSLIDREKMFFTLFDNDVF